MRAPLLLSCTLLLSACESRLPGSFQVTSVTVREQVDPGEMLPWYSSAMNPGRRAVRLLRIEAHSDLDLVEYARRHAMRIGYDVHHCDDGAALGPTVYSGAHPMVGERSMGDGITSPPSIAADARDGQGLITYAFIVPLDESPFREIHQSATSAGDLYVPLYDAAATAGHLCLRIHGGDVAGGHVASTPVIVSRGEILKAVAPGP